MGKLKNSEYLLTSVDDDDDDETTSSKVRDLFLAEEVTEESMKKLIVEIIKVNRIDAKKEKELQKYKRDPITIFINSPGGEVYSCLGLIDVIQESITPIYTKVIGIAASAAGIIFVSGHKRFMGLNSTIMYHNIQSGQIGDQFDFKDEFKEIKRLQKIIDRLYTERSNITQESLEAWKVSKRDKYIDFRMAKRFKLITVE